MDALYEVQKELQKNIANSFSNFRKKEASKMTKVAAQTRLNALGEWYSQFTANHRQLLIAKDIPRDHDYFTQNLIDIVLDSYFDRKGEFLELLEDLRKKEMENDPPLIEGNVSEPGARSPVADPHSLPKINLPKFSGGFHEWKNFRDLFRSVVHRRNDLDSSIKYYYLRTHLTGEGLEHIKAIPIAAEHYDRAWNTLVEYYDNKRRTISTLINKMLSVKLMSTESVSELKRVSAEVFSPLESLYALGKTEKDVGNDLVVHLVVQHFENGTKKDWKKSLDTTNDTPPTISQLKAFIASQLETLDSLEEKTGNTSGSSSVSKGKHFKGKSPKQESEANAVHSLQTTKDATVKVVKCVLCNAEHTLAKCEQFLKKSVADRREFAKSKRLCYNCLLVAYTKVQCKSRLNCFTCRGRHHTLLHTDNSDGLRNSENCSSPKTNIEVPSVSSACSNVTIEQVNTSTPVLSHSTQAIGSTGILLATAKLYVTGTNSKQYLVRALIDPCSQVTLITQSMCNQLGLANKLTHVCIKGVGENSSALADKLVSFSLSPHFVSNSRLTVEALVLPKISSYIPPVVTNQGCFKHLTGLQLADPEYTTNTRIDLLLKAGVYADIVSGEVVKGSSLQPIALGSKFGWLITGRVPVVPTQQESGISSHTVDVLYCSCSDKQESDIATLLQEFWRTEEVVIKNSCTKEEQICEDLFVNSTRKDQSGRYVVRLPWKDQAKLQEVKLGSSFPHSLRALKHLEANFAKDDRLKLEYSKFTTEYIELGHMSAITEEIASEHSDFFFLPHNGV